MWATWLPIVRAETNRRAPICLLDSPRASRQSTSTSRSERPAGWAARAGRRGPTDASTAAPASRPSRPRGGLLPDAVRDRDLAEIVEQGGDAQGLPFAGREPGDCGGGVGAVGDAGGVAEGERGLEVDEPAERLGDGHHPGRGDEAVRRGL